MSLKGDQGEEMQPLYLLQNTSVIYPSVVKIRPTLGRVRVVLQGAHLEQQ
jgi:hypothetical protein